MNEVTVVHTGITDSHQAGIALGLQVRENLLMPPDIIILFAAPQYNHNALLQALKRLGGVSGHRYRSQLLRKFVQQLSEFLVFSQ